MRLASLLLAATVLVACVGEASAAFPGNGYWGVGPTRKPRGETIQPVGARRRGSYPLDVYPRPNPHVDNSLLGRGLSSGGAAYLTNQYQGHGASMSYGYWDGGFNPGLYGFSLYPHFDRPGFTYWQGGD
ncbi:MAG TPA: hypothetical protein VG826_02240 [Pirellulales bacterium]|nr:hypothetical protein [Pirellulales bacterium]